MKRENEAAVNPKKESLKLANEKRWNRLFVALYILIILKESPAYGNLISERIKEMSNGLYKPNPNALYPVLRSLEDSGEITGEWDNPETRGKRFYYITDAGIDLIPLLKTKVRERLIYLEDMIEVSRKNFKMKK